MPDIAIKSMVEISVQEETATCEILPESDLVTYCDKGKFIMTTCPG